MKAFRSALILTVLVFFSAFTLVAQVQVKGRVLDTNGQPVEGASITLSPQNDKNSIIAYTFSNTDGAFTLKLNKSYQTVLLTIRCLGYHDVSRVINLTKREELVFTLEEKKMYIQEVIVKSKPIKQQGDTIKYLVSSFAKGKDFSIGDVLKNMPGFQVESDGTVYYEGKPIQKYYIEGLDLMGGGYNVVNKNLPHKSVGAVEVLKRHQPIKILENVIPSNATAINLKLKNNIAVTGSTNLGAGYEPYLYDVNVTPMLFKKNEQLVFTGQANNVGKELESQFNIIEITNNIISGFDALKPRYVSVSHVPSPSINMERYYDNNSKLASLKYLVKLNDKWEAKFDVNYYSDISYKKGTVNKTYFFADSSVNFYEATNNKLKNNSLRIGSRLTQNSKRLYLNSITNFTRYWNDDYSSIDGYSPFLEKASYPSYIFSNTNDVVFKHRNNFHQLFSNINYLNTTQDLIISPGVFTGLLNDSLPYESSTQKIATNRLKIDAFYKLGYVLGKWVLELKPLINVEKGQILTNIYKDNQLVNVDSFKSDKSWLLLKPGIKPSLLFKNGSLNVNFGFPVYSRILSESDISNDNSKTKPLTIFEPYVNFNYKISSTWTANMVLSYTQNVSNPGDITNGYVIQSHRLISRNNYFNYGRNGYVRAELSYSNPLSGIGFNIDYRKRYTANDYIKDKLLLENGLLSYTYKRLDNISESDNFKASFSYFFSELLSNINIEYNFYRNVSDELLSGSVYKAFNYWNSIKSLVNLSFIDNFEFEYSIKLDFINYSLNSFKSESRYLSHKFDVLYYTKKNIYFGIESEYYKFNDFNNSRNESVFLNAFLNVELRNGRYILNFMCNNLLDARSFDVYATNQNMITYSSVLLRPRSFIVSLKMPLMPSKQN
ncbi:MAG: hypothetical protein PWR03_1827 [Tenuifilum sp.]|jgi:hypothetical protein|uniref:carboxypeptidase regulatory-like domain-containing protein n=1 Tax=Tenuifilum sp. TaxID=2760880 RepID=UPI0024AC231F|nr:carboxypeptidase regulatory-like domain-containing protein [Tenuifilum sp.]MDI3527644.1 hypothetical protein [Tenuifilum sp.]